ncbi:unnamed protein product, partial [Iphiclides podalirius]
MTTFAPLPFVKAGENLALKGGGPSTEARQSDARRLGGKRTMADGFRINAHLASPAARSPPKLIRAPASQFHYGLSKTIHSKYLFLGAHSGITLV